MGSRLPSSDRGPAGARGFTYVGLLLTVAIMAAGLAAIGEVASTAAKRDREAELLFVGNQFAQAIAQYAAASPGAQQYPPTLEDLLADKRYPNVRRHLRRIYPDPLTGRADWVLVRVPGGGIVGLHSQSLARPLKTANFPPGYESFNGATTYSAWQFVPPATGAPAAKSAAPAALGPGQPAPAAPPRPGATMPR